MTLVISGAQLAPFAALSKPMRRPMDQAWQERLRLLIILRYCGACSRQAAHRHAREPRHPLLFLRHLHRDLRRFPALTHEP